MKEKKSSKVIEKECTNCGTVVVVNSQKEHKKWKEELDCFQCDVCHLTEDIDTFKDQKEDYLKIVKVQKIMAELDFSSLPDGDGDFFKEYIDDLIYDSLEDGFRDGRQFEPEQTYEERLFLLDSEIKATKDRLSKLNTPKI